MTDVKRQLLALMKRHKQRCAYCDQHVSCHLPQGHPRKATRDHVVPKSAGGSNRLSNLVLACFECNNRRGNQKPEPGTPRPAAHKRAMQAAAILAGVA